jgi:hypothetical protein
MQPTDIQLAAFHEAVNCFPPQQISQFLLDVFFQYIQTSIYYVEESWAYGFLDRMYSDCSALGLEDISELCMFLMLIACGTQFAHLESFQLTEQMANDPSTPPYFSEDDIGQKFHQAARGLVSYIMTTPSIRSVQAFLLLATYNFSLDSHGAAYIHLSMALSMAVQQDMHRLVPSDIDGPNSVMLEVRKRIWWTVHVLHIQSSLRYGRPKFLASSDITVGATVDMPELQPSKDPSTFRNQAGLIYLSLTTQRIGDEIAALRRTKSPTHFLNILSIRQELIAWWDKTSEELDKNQQCLRNDIHLRLYHWTARQALGRPFLLSAPASFESNPSATASDAGSGCGSPADRLSLVQDAVHGALEVINLCQILRERVGLARASYFTEFTSCQTAMLILLARSLTDLSLEIRHALTRGLAILKIMSIGNSLAGSEAGGIEVLERAVIRLKSTKAPRTGAGAGSPQDASKYDTLRTWSRLWQSSTTGTAPPMTTTTTTTTTSSSGGARTTQSRSEGDYPQFQVTESSVPNTLDNSDPGIDGDDAFDCTGITDKEMFYDPFSLELSHFDIIPDPSPVVQMPE